MNFKNPTAILFARMAKARKGDTGSLAQLMANFFSANFGDITIPKTVADFAIFDQLVAVGQTTLQFFNGQFTTARSNFPGGAFVAPNSEHMLVLGLKLYEGANATVNATDWAPGVSDAALKNATLDVFINGQKVVTQLPLTMFDPNELSATNSGRTDDGRGVFYFYEPLVVLGQQIITIQVNIPTASAVANLNLRAEIQGIRFIGG